MANRGGRSEAGGAEAMKPLDAGDLPTRLRLQAGHCLRLGSPLYANLLQLAADDAEEGGPVAGLLRGHEDDPVNSMPALRLMGAVHRRVLEGALPDLEPFYLSSGVTYDRIAGKRNTTHGGTAWPAFRHAVTEDAEALRKLVDRPVQTNEVGRCAVLLPGFLAVARETGMPLRLLEVGASAGLNLRWDRYRYEAEGFSWGDPDSSVRLDFQIEGEPPQPIEVTVVERRGCDRAPIDPTSEDGRLSLLSYLWPDQAHRVERVRAALDLAAEVPVTIDRAGAADWVGSQLAERREGVATVVFHSIVMQYLDEGERRRFEARIREAGERADAAAPLAWLRMEPAGERAEVRLTLWPDGEDRVIARAGYHGDLVDFRRAV
jgi:hypothetical protein